jgi:hypothetical protein
MLRVIACLALLACGSKKDSAPTTPSTSTTTETSVAADDQPLPPVTKIGDACRLSKDCAPLGPNHKCMRTGETAACYPSPMKTSCDAPDCSCFNNDPCAANELGTCTGYETGVVICSK